MGYSVKTARVSRRNLGVNLMAALALFGAVLAVVVLFFTFSAEGARKGFAEGNCDDANVALWEDFEETSGNLTVPTGCAAAATGRRRNSQASREPVRLILSLL